MARAMGAHPLRPSRGLRGPPTSSAPTLLNPDLASAEAINGKHNVEELIGCLEIRLRGLLPP
jgi:hypothetical protein